MTTIDRASPPAGGHDDIVYPSAIPFVLMHLACFAAIWTGVTWQAVALGVGLYWLRIFAIGAGYHRYFSHRAYSTSRVFQFILAVLSQIDHPEERAVVGGQAPAPSSAFRHRSRRAFAAPPRLHLQPSRLDLLAPARRIRSGEGRRPDALSRTALAAPAREGAGAGAGGAVLADRRLAGAGGRLHLEHGRGLSRHLLHQFARPRARPQALRHRRRLAQQLAARLLHHGRGLAQQPPRLPGKRAPGLPLVGIRHDLLHPHRAVLVRRGVGPEEAVGRRSCATSSRSARA